MEHVIELLSRNKADDGTNWKKACPTFNMVLEKIVDFFKMDVKATRFNWYRDSNDWKPYHHDAAAVKPDKGIIPGQSRPFRPAYP